MKFVLLLAILLIKPIYAEGLNNKYVTIVNPVRGRELWKDKSLSPIQNQYQIIEKLGLKATWLIQNDVLNDKELVNYLKKFNPHHELGIFLEVSKILSEKSKVYYPTETEWYHPKAVFLSGYKLSQRKRLIDTILADFKNTFGYFPKSAGAWWIDSWSQQYLEKKYQIKTILIVADQRTTDNYGVWGQWWGYPYYPSPNNILVPGNSPTVIVQWAQRDLEKAYFGQGSNISSYSLQANDYTGIGLNFSYFEKLAKQYLEPNTLGQITIGLETGMESVGQEKEYEKQLIWTTNHQITSVKLSDFGKIYGEFYGHKNPKKITLGSWTLTPKYRENKNLKELTFYSDQISFADKFIDDKAAFLNRVLPQTTTRKNHQYFPFFLLLIPPLYFWSKKINPILWTIVLFLPVFQSFYQSGWKIFFGPTIDHLIISQLLLIGVGGVIIIKLYQKLKIHWSSWWAAFGFNLLIFTARISLVEGKYYLGWLINSVHFIGISWGGKIKFINQDFPGHIAANMLKFHPGWIWGQWWTWIILYPLLQILLVMLINKFLSQKLRYPLIILSLGLISYLLRADPVFVK